jgi:hypothetical protein
MSTGIIGGNIVAMGVFQVSVDIASTATITTTETDVTVPGVRPGDFVFVNKPSHSTGLGIANARVKAADTVSIQAVNPTAGTINPAAETYIILWVRPETATTGITP